MAGRVALVLCAILIWYFFRMTREPNQQTSKALWLPTFWFFIAASRNISEWLQHSTSGGGDQYLEGNPLDRAVLTAVLAIGVIILVGRYRQVATLLRSNFPILLYFFYCGISFLWSDFPDVSFKRWFRAIGDVVMILVVLTDANWSEALKRLLTRVGFLVIPLSAVFIRYFPELGRSYSRGGQPSWTGVGTDKNALGIICAVFGLSAVYFFLQLYHKEGRKNRRALIAYGIIIAVGFYLLWESNSATAFACFFLAGSVMVLTYLLPSARKPVFLHLAVAIALLVPFSAMFLGIGSGLVENIGRNTTFTGRTAIWHAALGLVSNPLLGAGFESFWLGRRLTQVENAINQGVNQAHNGYIEVYLNLGWVGVILLAVLLITGYRRIVSAARHQTLAGSLRLAYFIVAIAYNFSEGGFKMMHPIWLVLLLATMIHSSMPVVESETLPTEESKRLKPILARKTSRPERLRGLQPVRRGL